MPKEVTDAFKDRHLRTILPRIFKDEKVKSYSVEKILIKTFKLERCR